MIVTFLQPMKVDNGTEQSAIDFLKQSNHLPHVVEIPPPSDPIIRTLLVPKAVRYFVIYTPTPVYFCEPTRGVYRIETSQGVFEATDLMKVWQLAKNI